MVGLHACAALRGRERGREGGREGETERKGREREREGEGERRERGPPLDPPHIWDVDPSLCSSPGETPGTLCVQILPIHTHTTASHYGPRANFTLRVATGQQGRDHTQLCQVLWRGPGTWIGTREPRT